MMVKRIVTASLCFLISTMFITAQEGSLQSAIALFDKGEFRESAEMLSLLIRKSERDPKTNYYYGAALTESNQNISEAIKRLKFAQINKYGTDLSFYQGRAAQLGYEFQQALDFYNRYVKFGKNKELLARAETYINQCEASIPLSSKIFDIKVVGRFITTKDNLLQYYDLSRDAGTLIVNGDFFESGVDPNGILYRTERKDAIYFTMQGDDKRANLYKMEQLIDGWGEEGEISELNSEADDIMPFVMTDGNTIYFASNREGGMGGYDIYKSTYDPDSRKFAEPVNLGVPFNSPQDDYLFVADEFKNVAWFASNRKTDCDSVEVFEIVWDNSVVRNMAMSSQEIKDAAALIPDPAAGGASTSKRPFTADKRIAQRAEVFRFIINDTLTYTDWDKFRSNEAKLEYEKAYNLRTLKDSLSNIMAQYRYVFSNTNSERERDEAVNKIIKIEKDAYSLDEQIENHQIKARLIEIGYLKDNKTDNIPTGASSSSSEKTNNKNLGNILIPKNFTYYTDDEFERQMNEWNLMYARLFDAYDIKDLHEADSMYVWGNILTLEASKLNEELLKGVPAFSAQSLIKGTTQEDEFSELRNNAKEYKTMALQLYHSSLDTKYRIFNDKANEIRLQDEGLDIKEFFEKQLEASTYYKMANELATQSGDNTVQYEKAGTMKRQAVYLLNDALFIYLSYIDGQYEPFEPKKPAAEVQQPAKTPQEEPKAASSEVKKQETTANQEVIEAEKSIKERIPSAMKPEYRVQLGLFRNRPNEAALSKLNNIKSVKMDGSESSKYYCGSFATYDEAVKMVPVAREAGFEGAFVVAFLGDEQITVAKAKEME